jgi:hypothetical protein
VISLLSDDEKENVGVSGNAIRQIAQEEKNNTPEEKPAPPDLPKTDVPSTPSSRLALPDLIGMGDVKRAVQDISPDERISWDYKEDDEDSSAPSFGPIRRAKKRARSSSPVNSSPALASAHFSGKSGASNPQVDPGSELWGRYSLNGSNAPTPQGPSVPALAHLMHTSSPQPSKEGTTPRSANGFRRANSCGNQFPKRRRLGGPEDGDVFTESANIGPSKLSVLIERVQEGMIQPRRSLSSSESSISSNAHDRRTLPDEDDSSPVHQKERREAKALATNPEPHYPQDMNKNIDIINPPIQSPSKSDSSDYGDFDEDEIDESLFEIANPQPVETGFNGTTSVPSELPPDPPPKIVRTPDQPSVNQTTAKPSVSPSTLKSVDEFGDFDDDVLGDDLEQVLSQFDKQAPVRATDSGLKKVGS